MALMIHMADGLEPKARIQTTGPIQSRTGITRRSPGPHSAPNMAMPTAFTSSANPHGLYNPGSAELSGGATGIVIERHRRGCSSSSSSSSVWGSIRESDHQTCSRKQEEVAVNNRIGTG